MAEFRIRKSAGGSTVRGGDTIRSGGAWEPTGAASSASSASGSMSLELGASYGTPLEQTWPNVEDAPWPAEWVESEATGTSYSDHHAAKRGYQWVDGGFGGNDDRIFNEYLGGIPSDFDLTVVCYLLEDGDHFPSVRYRGTAWNTAWEVRLDPNNNVVELYKLFGGTEVTGLLDFASVSMTTSDQVNIRIRATGPEHKVKVWVGSEPSDWTLEYTLDTYSENRGFWLGLIGGTAASSHDTAWDNLDVVNLTNLTGSGSRGSVSGAVPVSGEAPAASDATATATAIAGGFSGSAPGASSARASFTGDVPVFGSAAGVSSASGAATVETTGQDLSGSAAAAADADATATVDREVAGGAPSVAFARGLPSGTVPVSGKASAASSARVPDLQRVMDLVWVVWDNEIDDPPTPTPIPTDGIKQAVYGSVTRVIRQVDIYEQDGTTAFMLDAPLVSGSVNVSMSSSERRTSDLVLYNEGGALDLYPDGLWYDKIIKVRRGAVTDTESYLGLLGTFMIDRVRVDAEKNTVQISCRDLTKKLQLAKFVYPTHFPLNEPIENVISAIATAGGVTDMNLPLTGASTHSDWVFETGTERWKAIKDIATAFNYEVYFDESGTLVMKEFADINLDPVAFVFKTGETGNLASFSKTASDQRMKNHIVVIGEAADRTPIIGVAENNNAGSPTAIAEIGRRTDIYDSSFVGSVAQAEQVAQQFLSIAGLEQFEVGLSAVVIPWLDVNNVITFVDPDPAPGDPSRFLLTDFSIPLELTPMNATVRRVINVT